MKKLLLIILSILMLCTLCACTNTDNNSNTKEEVNKYPNSHLITLDGDSATIDGVKIEEFDYTWHVDPSEVHDEDSNTPAEYYTGSEPNTDSAVYIDHELFYYPSLDTDGFKLVNYDGEREWAYYYTDGVNNDFIFATLPNFNNTVPSAMMHTEEEALKNKVLHITEPGTYILEGSWDGQIFVDLGDEDETFADENAKITLVLDGVNIKCTVAPGIIFYSAYEVDNSWEAKNTYTYDVDTTNAGVNVIIADDTANYVDGQNVYRMLKTKYKDEDSTDEVKVQKKARKTDAAFYSYVTMNIASEEKGTGTLEITSSFEGLDTELHLTILGGNITINSEDDGINVNEDNVSVVSFLGGNITINAANGAEGDGVDSNGFAKIDGANLNINGVVAPDNAIDTEDGVYYASGTITIDGVTKELEPGLYQEISGENQGFGPGNQGGPGGFDPNNMNEMFADFDIKEFKEKVAALGDDATIDDVLEILGVGMFVGGMQNGQTPPEMPDGQTPPDMQNGENPPDKPN